MNCEEFEAIGLGLGREGRSTNDAEAAERAAALQHASSCARCAALQESWQEARLGLQALREATHDAEASARVEMRLRQEFRTKHGTLKLRRRLIFAAWTVATAAVVLGIVSWRNWRAGREQARNQTAGVTRTTAEQSGGMQTPTQAGTEQETLFADNEGDFTLLPGSLPQETQDAEILRVRMQRGTLGAMGLPVNEESASDWIQVDLLVGEDGQPRAVRLPAGAETSQ